MEAEAEISIVKFEIKKALALPRSIIFNIHLLI